MLMADVIGSVTALYLVRVNWVAALAVLTAVLVGGCLSGSYESRLTLDALSEAPSVTGRVMVAVALLVIVPGPPAAALREIGWPALAAGCVTGVVLARCVTYAFVRGARRRLRSLRKRTLIVGSGELALHIARCVREHPEYGLEVEYELSDHRRRRAGPPLSASLPEQDKQLSDVLARTRVQVVVVASTSKRQARLAQALHGCRRKPCEIYVVPKLSELPPARNSVERVWGITLLRLRHSPLCAPTWRLKRAFDLIVAATAIVLLSPVMLVCAILVRLDSGPGVLFRQQRVGRDGKPFCLLKFRTLAPAELTESDVHWNVRGDARISPIGRLLRKTSLDELPQLFNVLTGQMSLVGPRPERPHFAKAFARTIPGYSTRHRVPPGITGWAQVNGLRGDTSIRDRAAFDNEYIENWSLWNDVSILLRTVPAMTRGAG